jgi:hypothetical protein
MVASGSHVLTVQCLNPCNLTCFIQTYNLSRSEGFAADKGPVESSEHVGILGLSSSIVDEFLIRMPRVWLEKTSASMSSIDFATFDEGYPSG